MASKKLLKRILFGLFAVIFFCIMTAGLALYAFFNNIQEPAVNNAGSPENQRSAGMADGHANSGERINILLMGLDDGDPDYPNSPRRSDAMIVASVNPADKTVNLLSIPRDTKIHIAGKSGDNKINAAYFYGGTELAQKTVEDFLGIPINYYVVIDWKAFIKVVDILGGVDIYVERDMNYEDPYENLAIHLRKGKQHLDGRKAGEYVRYRHDELGDIGRVQRQQQFMQALTDQMLQAGTILKLPSLMSTISHYVKTDMNSYTMLKVANVLKDINADSLHTVMVPGDFATIDGISYWVPDLTQTQKVVTDMLGTLR